MSANILEFSKKFTDISQTFLHIAEKLLECQRIFSTYLRHSYTFLGNSLWIPASFLMHTSRVSCGLFIAAPMIAIDFLLMISYTYIAIPHRFVVDFLRNFIRSPTGLPYIFLGFGHNLLIEPLRIFQRFSMTLSWIYY